MTTPVLLSEKYSNTRPPVMPNHQLAHLATPYTLHMDLFGPISDETSGILKDFIIQIEHQLNQKVKTIRCDNGTEFKNKDVIELCTKDIIDEGDSEKEDESAQDCFVLPIWSSYSSIIKRSRAEDVGAIPHKHSDLKTDEKPVDQEDLVFLDELERLKRQKKDANNAAEALRKEFA
ncbi:putative ribonuclease H-like domain-containing protein [Tanacetum coccineum]